MIHIFQMTPKKPTFIFEILQNLAKTAAGRDTYMKPTWRLQISSRLLATLDQLNEKISLNNNLHVKAGTHIFQMTPKKPTFISKIEVNLSKLATSRDAYMKPTWSLQNTIFCLRRWISAKFYLQRYVI